MGSVGRCVVQGLLIFDQVPRLFFDPRLSLEDPWAIVDSLVKKENGYHNCSEALSSNQDEVSCENPPLPRTLATVSCLALPA